VSSASPQWDQAHSQRDQAAFVMGPSQRHNQDSVMGIEWVSGRSKSPSGIQGVI